MATKIQRVVFDRLQLLVSAIGRYDLILSVLKGAEIGLASYCTGLLNSSIFAAGIRAVGHPRNFGKGVYW